MPRRGRKRKKSRTHVVENDAQASALSTQEQMKIPRSLVVRRGKVEKEVIDLVLDLRNTMMPYTALKFQEDTKSAKLAKSLQHYAKELSSSLGITHILSLSQSSSATANPNPQSSSDKNTNIDANANNNDNNNSSSSSSGGKLSLRLARTPAGPTLTFKIQQFSISKHIRKVQRRPFDMKSSKITSHPPIVVTNNFGDATAAPHVKLMRITFQNMFPALNVATVKLRDCRRVVLFNFMRRDRDSDESNSNSNNSDNEGEGEFPEEDEEVEVRHYAIRANPVGIDKKVRRIIQAKIPNLSKLEDISDYITGTTASGDPSPAASGAMSDSEAEDETSHVILPQKYSGRGNAQSQKSALKLVELGPRIRMKLTKVERGLASGDVMYHAYVKKDAGEVKAQKEKVEMAAALKKRRREEQEENVRRKKEVRQEKLERKRRKREERTRVAMEELRASSSAAGGGGGGSGNEDDDNDDDDDSGSE